MSAKAQRARKRRIKLVGGGFRYNRDTKSLGKGGSAKSVRRALRRQAKNKKLSVAERRAIKEQVRELYKRKNGAT